MTRAACIGVLMVLAASAARASQAVPVQPGTAASAPKPPAAIAAARDAAASVGAAQQKNADQPPLKLRRSAEALAQAEALDQKSTPPPQPAAAPPANPSGPVASTPAAGGATLPNGPAGYSYDPNGRRDPFVSLLFRGAESSPAGATRPPGLPGQLTSELTVKGVMKAKEGFVAILQGSDNKTYIGHSGDRVLDGSIKSISQEAVVFSQDVNDPLSLVKQREVRKAIRPETK